MKHDVVVPECASVVYGAESAPVLFGECASVVYRECTGVDLVCVLASHRCRV